MCGAWVCNVRHDDESTNIVIGHMQLVLVSMRALFLSSSHSSICLCAVSAGPSRKFLFAAPAEISDCWANSKKRYCRVVVVGLHTNSPPAPMRAPLAVALLLLLVSPGALAVYTVKLVIQ